MNSFLWQHNKKNFQFFGPEVINELTPASQIFEAVLIKPENLKCEIQKNFFLKGTPNCVRDTNQLKFRRYLNF